MNDGSPEGTGPSSGTSPTNGTASVQTRRASKGDGTTRATRFGVPTQSANASRPMKHACQFGACKVSGSAVRALMTFGGDV